MQNKWRSAAAAAAVVVILVALPAVSQSPNRSGTTPGRSNKSPQVGEPAPDFNLRTKDGKMQVQLSSFRGKRPVVIILGSYT